MAEMTLERAEKILGEIRQTYYICKNADVTDIEIARKQHRTLSNAAIGLALFAVNQIRYTIKDSGLSLILMASLTLILLGFAVYAFLKATHFDKIRELFENAGPKNLADLGIQTTSATSKN
jgi:hypothetical protein